MQQTPSPFIFSPSDILGPAGGRGQCYFRKYLTSLICKDSNDLKKNPISSNELLPFIVLFNCIRSRGREGALLLRMFQRDLASSRSSHSTLSTDMSSRSSHSTLSTDTHYTQVFPKKVFKQEPQYISQNKTATKTPEHTTKKHGLEIHKFPNTLTIISHTS